ncbi:MAG TPA: hypothetical protein VHZ76_02900 [Gammaproteobacteria bacterium]|jgi:hypothetical protein|nr:hypothetical protein [Gammaproteobacteria bacterium]
MILVKLRSVFLFLTRNMYRKHITLVVIVKLIALFALWWWCFSEPVSKTLDSEVVAEHFME